MNVINGSLANYGLIGQVGIRANALSDRETSLTEEVTTGLVSSSITGLGASTSEVLNLQPQLAQLDALTSNATMASSRLQVAQSAMTSISAIASTLATNLTQLSTEQGSALPTALSSTATTAKGDLSALASALNTTFGGIYVFGGADETTQPVTNPGAITSGPLSASIAASVSGLATNGASATLSAVISAMSTNSVFAAGLVSNPQPSLIDVGLGETATVGLPATSTSGMNAASATSTGSSVNDLIAVLSALSSLDPGQAGNPQLGGFLSGLQQALTGSQNGLSTITSTLGVAQQQVSAASDTNAAVSNALTTQLGSLTSVDIPTVATQLTATQNQLMASYEIVSDLKGLSLAAYI